MFPVLIIFLPARKFRRSFRNNRIIFFRPRNNYVSGFHFKLGRVFIRSRWQYNDHKQRDSVDADPKNIIIVGTMLSNAP